MEFPAGVKVYYIRDKNNAPVLSVAIKRNGDTGTIIRATAHCSTLDKVSKKKGRMIAVNRLVHYEKKGVVGVGHVPPPERNRINPDSLLHWHSGIYLMRCNGAFCQPMDFEKRILKMN